MENGRVLVFSSREICYYSGNFFANQLASAFEEIGYWAELCELSKGEDFDQKLAPYMEKEYEVIVDFNSLLPRLVLDDGSYYLDHLNGPFFDYILDHPLFHYAGLTSDASNLHVLVLDESHQTYAQKYYPKLSGVHMLPLGATQAVYQEKKLHADRILFLGTYDTTDHIKALIEQAPAQRQAVMRHLIERRIAQPLLPMEEAFLDYLREREIELDAEAFALAMNEMYPVDAYVRDYFREKAVETLLAGHIPVVAVGEGWEKFKTPHHRFLTTEKAVTFSLSFEKIARESALLNAFPVFHHGMHDRIAAGMANRTVVLTDRNPYLEKHFTDEKQLCFYDLNRPESLLEKADRLLSDAPLRERIGCEAYENFSENHTWKKRAQQILKLAALYRR